MRPKVIRKSLLEADYMAFFLGTRWISLCILWKYRVEVFELFVSFDYGQLFQ